MWCLWNQMYIDCRCTSKLVGYNVVSLETDAYLLQVRVIAGAGVSCVIVYVGDGMMAGHLLIHSWHYVRP